MESFLNGWYGKVRHAFSRLRLRHRVTTVGILMLLGLGLAFGLPTISNSPSFSQESINTPLVCSSTSTLAAEQLSAQGRVSYEKGQFADAIDCWKRAAVTYRQQGNEVEAVNNQVNQAQAEQSLGLYPRACKTLMDIYGYRELSCANLPDQATREFFLSVLQQRVDSPVKIAGLRGFGNVLRNVGELELSAAVLQLSQKLSPVQEQTAIQLDLGNTGRALSNKEQDLFNRSQNRRNINNALEQASSALSDYQQVINNGNAGSGSPSILQLQARLNQLNLLLDLQDWQKQVQQLDKQAQQDPIWQRLTTPQWSSEIQSRLKQLPALTQLTQQLSTLQAELEALPLNHTTLFTRINFAQTLMRLETVTGTDATAESLLRAIAKQARELGDGRAESYALGYLGKQLENKARWDQAIQATQQALMLAQSLPAPDMMYQWQWQLGRIYRAQMKPENFSKTKQQQRDTTEAAARSAYQGTYKTLESLRRELATGNPDTQLVFQKDIDSIYREYVDVLLRADQPTQSDLSQAREVIASLQTVELENFLRQACPEYSLRQIDQIVDTQSPKAAFLHPIVLDDRIEVILKLPSQSGQKSQNELKHYRTAIPRSDVERKVRQLQSDLEEEYTFEAIFAGGKEVYQWLVQGAEPYLGGNIDTLVFALDTTLRNLPLAALVSGGSLENPDYLIEKYAIALAPRLQLPAPERLPDGRVNLVAAGVVESAAKPAEVGQTYPKLPFVEQELKQIQAISSDAKIAFSQLLNNQFTTANFQRKLNTSTFQILHLATHGEFSSLPEQTFILAQDKELTSSAIDLLFRQRGQNVAQPIELLVLSACETAAGDQRATLGISGVAVRAGARSVIASLWTLDDRTSAEFSTELYRILLNNPTLSKAQALQQAQMALMSRPGRDHPRHWAPYILIGNWL